MFRYESIKLWQRQMDQGRTWQLVRELQVCISALENRQKARCLTEDELGHLEAYWEELHDLSAGLGLPADYWGSRRGFGSRPI